MSEIEIVPEFISLPEGIARTLRVYAPEAYWREPRRRFPVMYMQDGQNVFDHPETWCDPAWGVNTAMEALVASGQLAPWIVVAIDHSEGRFHEYSLWDEPRSRSRGLGSRYLDFLVHHLKPQVDKHLRTLPDARNTAIVGSSLGGLAALGAGLRRPDVFGRIGAFSPSVMWGEARLFSEWSHHFPTWNRIYVDVGQHEEFLAEDFWMDYARDVPRFVEHLRGLKYTDEELRFVVDPKGNHSEADWRRRLPEALKWLLGDADRSP